MSEYLKTRITDELYHAFQDACEERNKTMSEVLRGFAKYYSESDNTILINLDNKILKQTIKLCKKEKIKFQDLMILLLENALNNKDNINFNR